MKSGLLGLTSLITLILTAMWLVLVVVGLSTEGPVETFEEAVASVAEPGALFYLTYINATLVTLSATVLFTVLYSHFQAPALRVSVIGVMFVPVYCVLNLLVYVSQIAVIPRLLVFQRMAIYEPAASLLIGQMVQQWSGSAIAALNNLAYAILGIPSIIFGALLLRQSRLLQVAGALLALNGIACLIGLAGTIAQSRVLQMGSLVGGILFLLALISLTLASLREGK